MRYIKRGLLQSITIQSILIAFIFIIQVCPLIAQTPDTLLAHSKADTTLYGSVTFSLKDQFDSLYVVVNKQFTKPLPIANNGTIHLPEGEYQLTLATKLTEDVSFPMEIKSGRRDTVRLPLRVQPDREVYRENSSYPVLHKGINVEISTDVDSRVTINDSTYGYGSTSLMLTEGSYRIVTSHPDAGRSVKEIRVKMNPPRFHKLHMFNKADILNVRIASFIPGGGQYFKKELLKAGILLSGFSAGILAGIHFHNRLDDHKADYEFVYRQYLDSRTEAEAFKLGNRAEDLHFQAKRNQRARNIVIGSLAGIYLYSVLDAWLNTPEGGYRNTDTRKSTVQPYLGIDTAGLQLKFQF